MDTSHPTYPPGLEKGPKGQYIWLYQVNLYRQNHLLILIWKIFFFIWLGISLFVFLLSLPEQAVWDSLKKLAPTMLLTGLLIMVLATLAYYAYALFMKGRYSVLFTMDEKGIRHSQVKAEAQKATKLAGLTTLAGLASGQPTVIGAGLMAGSTSLYTAFKRVRKIKVNASRQTIKLRSSLLTHNQIYTSVQDFDFVLNFIKERIPPAAKIR